jgi:hypothetical protein
MFGGHGNPAGSIFAVGPIMTSCQSGARGDGRNQVDIQALVDDSEEPDPWPRQRRDGSSDRPWLTGGGKVCDVDAAREQMNVWMTPLP